MPVDTFQLAPATETGLLGVCHLKRLWSRIMAARQGLATGRSLEGQLDKRVIHALGLGLEQTLAHLSRTGPTFEAFERWILDTTGGVDPSQVARINAAITGAACPGPVQAWIAEVEAATPVLSPEELASWEADGYVVLHDAVTEEQRAAAEEALWAHLGARADDPESWYRAPTQGIMVQLFQHPALDAIRRSPRIHKAFSQLWGTADLWASTDRCGFNAPQREGARFPGPDLHWDVSLRQPIPFGTQGLVYLTDTPPEQGALTVVPGFQHRIEAWLQELPPREPPRQQDLHALGSKPIGGRAGDFVIWHQALPHGSRPNLGMRPRLVHYLNLEPFHVAEQGDWI